MLDAQLISSHLWLLKESTSFPSSQIQVICGPIVAMHFQTILNVGLNKGLSHLVSNCQSKRFSFQDSKSIFRGQTKHSLHM